GFFRRVGGCQRLPIRRKLERLDPKRVAAQRQQLAPRGRFPDADRVIMAPRSQFHPVRSEHEHRDPRGVPVHLSQFFLGGGLRQYDDLVHRGGPQLAVFGRRHQVLFLSKAAPTQQQRQTSRQGNPAMRDRHNSSPLHNRANRSCRVPGSANLPAAFQLLYVAAGFDVKPRRLATSARADFSASISCSRPLSAGPASARLPVCPSDSSRSTASIAGAKPKIATAPLSECAARRNPAASPPATAARISPSSFTDSFRNTSTS